MAALVTDPAAFWEHVFVKEVGPDATAASSSPWTLKFPTRTWLRPPQKQTPWTLQNWCLAQKVDVLGQILPAQQSEILHSQDEQQRARGQRLTSLSLSNNNVAVHIPLTVLSCRLFAAAKIENERDAVERLERAVGKARSKKEPESRGTESATRACM